MLQSSGYFSSIHCPYFSSGFCERPHCHFKHVKKDDSSSAVRNDISSAVESKADRLKIYSETVRRIQEAEKELLATSTLQSPVVAYIPTPKNAVSRRSSQESHIPAMCMPEYRPTPISQLRKMHRDLPFGETEYMHIIPPKRKLGDLYPGYSTQQPCKTFKRVEEYDPTKVVPLGSCKYSSNKSKLDTSNNVVKDNPVVDTESSDDTESKGESSDEVLRTNSVILKDSKSDKFDVVTQILQESKVSNDFIKSWTDTSDSKHKKKSETLTKHSAAGSKKISDQIKSIPNNTSVPAKVDLKEKIVEKLKSVSTDEKTQGQTGQNHKRFKGDEKCELVNKSEKHDAKPKGDKQVKSAESHDTKPKGDKLDKTKNGDPHDTKSKGDKHDKIKSSNSHDAKPKCEKQDKTKNVDSLDTKSKSDKHTEKTKSSDSQETKSKSEKHVDKTHKSSDSHSKKKSDNSKESSKSKNKDEKAKTGSSHSKSAHADSSVKKDKSSNKNSNISEKSSSQSKSNSSDNCAKGKEEVNRKLLEKSSSHNSKHNSVDSINKNKDEVNCKPSDKMDTQNSKTIYSDGAIKDLKDEVIQKAVEKNVISNSSKQNGCDLKNNVSLCKKPSENSTEQNSIDSIAKILEDNEKSSALEKDGSHENNDSTCDEATKGKKENAKEPSSQPILPSSIQNTDLKDHLDIESRLENIPETNHEIGKQTKDSIISPEDVLQDSTNQLTSETSLKLQSKKLSSSKTSSSGKTSSSSSSHKSSPHKSSSHKSSTSHKSSSHRSSSGKSSSHSNKSSSSKSLKSNHKSSSKSSHGRSSSSKIKKLSSSKVSLSKSSSRKHSSSKSSSKSPSKSHRSNDKHSDKHKSEKKYSDKSRSSKKSSKGKDSKTENVSGSESCKSISNGNHLDNPIVNGDANNSDLDPDMLEGWFDDMESELDNHDELEECWRIFNEDLPQTNTQSELIGQKPKSVRQHEEQSGANVKTQTTVPTRKRVAHLPTSYMDETVNRQIVACGRKALTSPAQAMAQRFSRLQEAYTHQDEELANRQSPPTAFAGLLPKNRVERRVAPVPNAAFLAAMSPPRRNSLTQQSAPNTNYSTAGPNITVASTISQGERRIAHQPNAAYSKRPIVPNSYGNKIAVNIRQRYLNLFIDECLKFSENEEAAFAKGLEEEAAAYDRSSNKTGYLNVAVNVLRRLRVDAEAGPPPAPPPTQPSLKVTSPPNNSAEKVPQPKQAPPRRLTSHQAMLGGSKAANISFGIERNKPKQKQEDILKGVILFNLMGKYLTPQEQLAEGGYPQANPSCPGKALIQGLEIRKIYSADTLHSQCNRCQTYYAVDKNGLHIRQEECVYHWGRIWKKRIAGSIESRYSCCEGDAESEGCCVGEGHVVENFDPEKATGFVQTLEKPCLDGNYGVYALDCEMCYTTQGMELTRITVISETLSPIYETMVKPENPVLDHNTRFSGITKEDLIGVHTTLRDVQAVLLSLFNSKTILLGHSLESDFKALRLIHNTVVDTALVFPHRRGPPFKRALRTLMAECLNKIIQNSDGGHDSQEDAVACMELMMWKIREDAKCSR